MQKHNKINQYKVHVKRVFLIYSILVFLVLFLLVSVFMYLNIYVFSSRNNAKMNAQLGKSIENQVQDYMAFLNTLEEDEAFFDSLRNGSFTEINRRLYEFVNAQRIKANFVLVDEHADILSSNLFASNQKMFLESELFQTIRGTSGQQFGLNDEKNDIRILPSRLHYSASQKGSICISKEFRRKWGYFDRSMSKQKRSNRSLPTQGLSNQKLPNQELPNQGMPKQALSHQDLSNQTLSNHSLSEQAFAEDKALYLVFDLLEEDLYIKVREYLVDDVIITDRYDNMMFYINRQFDDPMGKYPSGGRSEYKSDDIVDIQGKRYNLKKMYLADQKLILYTFVQLEFQRMLFTYNMFFLVLFGILLLFTLPFIIHKVTRHHVQSLEKMEHYIEKIGRGDTLIKIDDSLFDEFKSLAQAFKQVVEQKDELILKNNELAERKRIMEIRQLEEQFNPHFVFNTLETLRYEMLIDTQKATEMIIAFAGMMRYSIYYGKTVMPLKVDLEYVKHYLSIQKIRYGNRLSYEIKIEESLLRCFVPKLILQPIVENSIRHGLQNKDSIHILIEAKRCESGAKRCESGAKRCESDLYLSVSDNGAGIEKSKLEEITKTLRQKDEMSEHKGLYNPNSVIKLIYGDEYGLEIESEVGIGTKVIMKIPAKTDDMLNYEEVGFHQTRQLK